ncbi:hypothetical protein [Archangium violaceum]|uniref:hypothetical protein n=1 Tax=Archangium violaceum TaxID=83451 RepID=UPI00069864D4|nr:hypothetical protein [Archangium violaceum]
MGRTYSFEPFKSQQPAQTYQGSGARLGNAEHELAPSQEHATPPKAPATYGQAHAETVKRYRSRAQARKRAPAVKAKGTASRPAAKKATAQTKSAAARKAPARKQTAAPKATTTRKPMVEKSPTRKSEAEPVSLRNVGRKVLSRAAAAAKKTVARAVKTAAKRVPTKKKR